MSVGEPKGGVSSPGVPVLAVLADTPAASAGLKEGDTLTSIDGRWTSSVADVYSAASAVAPGRATEVVILRDGEEKTVTITPKDGI
jgi:S1-C subfamily serine protease